jgi:tripeptide aminopeptidase
MPPLPGCTGIPKTIMDWQAGLVAIPAPPFGEALRSEWLAARFAEIGLSGIETDEVGNVFGVLVAGWPPAKASSGRAATPASGAASGSAHASSDASLPAASGGPVVMLSAHLDTVFPAETPLNPVVDGDRLTAPGACDNGAGVAGMLAIAQALLKSKAEVPVPLIFMGNVGEEGEGDLRGVRHLYDASPLARRIAAHIVLDGAGAESAVTQALGSRRFRVTVSGPGGHSFTDAGTPNPIAALASALSVLAQTELPEQPRTTLNLGTIQGGTSVNSIPESATATIDFRSTGAEGSSELRRLEAALHGAVEEAVAYWNAQGKPSATRSRGLLSFNIVRIGDRPCRTSGRRLAAAGGAARRGSPSGGAHRPAAGLNRRQYPAFAGHSGAVSGRRRRGQRRAHAGRVVLRQGPRNGPEAGPAADPG